MRVAIDPLTLELRSAEAPTSKSTLADASTYVLGYDRVFEVEEGATKHGQLRLITQHQQLYVEASTYTP